MPKAKRRLPKRILNVEFLEDVHVEAENTAVVWLHCEEGKIRLRFTAYSLRRVAGLIARQLARNPRFAAESTRYLKEI